ncbi:MAG: T9SS type A sorting domain-containing protein, partial [Bacteroidales bacterium]|nr:T9SS type A sorting domain-containing protein [Bacteroidales bacterium]
IDSTYYTTIFDTICDNETYTENGFNTAFAGTYENTLQATIGCDSVITLHLTVNPTYTEMVYDTIYVEEGRDSSYYLIDSLQTIFGCDSVVVHNITIIVDPVSITENSDISDNLDLYPNPTTGIITFNRTDVMKVEVLDAMGRLLMTIENKHIIDLSKLSQGYYTLRVTLPEGVTVRKVIKQ